MGTSIVGSTIITATPGTSLLALTPTDSFGEPVVEGDLLLFAFVIINNAANNATDFRTALTLPTGWQHAGFTATATNRIIFAFKYVEVDDPNFYTFTYLNSVTMAGLMIAVRGPARDYNTFTPIYTPANFTLPNVPFENGFFAPSGSVGAVAGATSTTLTTVNGLFPHTVPIATRVISVALQADVGNGAPPLLDDPVALPTLHQKARIGIGGADSMSLILFDKEYETANLAPPTAITITSNENRPWIVASIAVEAFDVLDGSEDNYKGKVMRGLLKEPWDTTWGSGISDVLTIIGASDNDIGGLFGDDDFLPSED